MFQDEEENVYKRDFSAPTLEDHFNKTILPKVMQVSPTLVLLFHGGTSRGTSGCADDFYPVKHFGWTLVFESAT